MYNADCLKLWSLLEVWFFFFCLNARDSGISECWILESRVRLVLKFIWMKMRFCLNAWIHWKGDYSVLPECLILEIGFCLKDWFWNFVGREIAVWLFDILESIEEKMRPYLQTDSESAASCTFRLSVLIVLLSCSWHGQTSCGASDVTDVLCKIIMTWTEVLRSWWRGLTLRTADDVN